MATKLDLADAQFTGYIHANKGYSAKSLAESMGLKKSEWNKLRDKLSLSESDKMEVDEIFIRSNYKEPF